MKIAMVVVASLVAVFVSITWLALEGSGVAVLETRAPDGSLRSTHVWFAEPDGELWLEAGAPENSWYLDVKGNPLVSFSSGRRSGSYEAREIQDSDAHDRIRALLREKYGGRDWWVGVLVDTSRSVAVRLTPAPGGP